MTDIVSKLQHGKGDVRTILGQVAGGDLLDVSDASWSCDLVVLRNLKFDRTLLRDRAILPEIIDSVFDRCEFRDVSSQAHFWGSSNVWRQTVFERIELENAVCPHNTFTDCRFSHSSLIGLRPYAALFVDCTFDHVRFEAFAAEVLRQKRAVDDRLLELGVSTAFVRCTFSKPLFNKCTFRSTAFVDCIVESPEIKHSSFEGSLGKPQWWPKETNGDPFVAFLDEVMSFITVRVGATSEASRVFRGYREEYVNGETSNRDYSACLYSGDVPDSELDLDRRWIRETGAPLRVAVRAVFRGCRGSCGWLRWGVTP